MSKILKCKCGKIIVFDYDLGIHRCEDENCKINQIQED